MGNQLSGPPRFCLIAELEPDGELTCKHTQAVEELLSTEIMNKNVVFIGVVENETCIGSGELRVIDFVQFLLEKHVSLVTSFADWSKQKKKHFPCRSKGNLPAELKGKNGIILQAQPYAMRNTYRISENQKKWVARDIYLLSMWIGNPVQMKDRGLKKLRDFLYCTSSMVLHSTPNLTMSQLNYERSIKERQLWDSCELDCLGKEKLETICFLFFNWTFNNTNAIDWKGKILGPEFQKWVARNYPVARACHRLSEKFRHSTFYGLSGPKPCAQFGNMHEPEWNILATTLVCSKPKLEYKQRSETIFLKYAIRLNWYYRQNLDISSLGHASTCSGTTLSRPNPCELESLQVRSDFSQAIEKLLQESNFDMTQLDMLYKSAVEQLQTTLGPTVRLQDIQAEVDPVWSQFTCGLAELDDLLLDLEAQLGAMLLTPNVNMVNVESFSKTAEQQLRSVCKDYGIGWNIAEARSGAFPFKISSVAQVLTNVLHVELKKPCLYLSDAEMDGIRTYAVAELTKSGFGQDFVAVAAVDMALNTFKIENDRKKHQAGLLAGETVQFAVEEYQKSMDRILASSIYYTKSLVDFHNAFLQTLATCLKSKAFKNDVWKAIEVQIKAKLESQFTQILEKNYSTCKELNQRRMSTQALTFETYLSNRGYDFHQLEPKTKKRAHVHARQTALNIFVEETKFEQAWVRKQWYDELFDGRIRSEEPTDSAQATTSLPYISPKMYPEIGKHQDGAELSEQRKFLVLDKVDRGSLPSSSAELVAPSLPKMAGSAPPDNRSGTTRKELETLVENMTSKLEQHELLSRSHRKDVVQALVDAQNVIDQSDASEPKLKLAISQLSLRKKLLGMSADE